MRTPSRRWLRNWSKTPWAWDMTLRDALVLTVGATLAVVHHGLIAPWAQQLMEASL